MRAEFFAAGLAVGLLVAPLDANAEPVVWELKGTLTQADGIYSGLADQPFVVFMGFDTEATLVRIDEGGRFDPGKRYTYDPASLYFDLNIGGESWGRVSGGDKVLQARDNSGDLFFFGTEPFPEIDGYFITAGEAALRVTWIIRGSILDIVNGPQLPADPDPRLLELERNAFSISQTALDESGDPITVGFILGSVESVRRYVDPLTQLIGLIERTVELNVQGGLGNSFDQKLQNALDSLERAEEGDTASAIGMLNAFINSVRAQRGKKLAVEQANELIADAQAIIDALSQP